MEQQRQMGLWNGARVFLELQRPNYTLNEPVEIFIDRYLPMHAEMHDGQGNVIASRKGWHPMDGPIPPRYTVTMPPDSTLRLHASTGIGTQSSDILMVAVPEASWAIPLGSTNEYLLSATFSPATNHPSALNYKCWGGTLHLPKVRIPTEKLKEP